MKNFLRISFRALLAVLCIAFIVPAFASGSVSARDPLNAKIYKLDNGLTVYISVYKDAPRIQTYIAVRAGSKNDPSDATGLAHYLEHMLFKGTDNYGTMNFDKEKSELDKIFALYETYRSTTDDAKRKNLYHQIDSISGVAAKYAIANEYDKMLSSVGAKGTNAYTWVEQTVYVNDIPANQFENWLTIEAERFRKPVFRIFHTELEAVYEEKNRSLDSDGSKAWDALYEGLFMKHTYGTQTTIGTIEHLKNPSLKKISEYYDSYYVPNNMAICLSGDIDPEAAIKMIREKFGKMNSKPVPVFNPPVEQPILKPIVKDVYGPDAETMMMAYRFPGAGTPDADMTELVSRILFNNQAGLLDLNLNQKQKVLSSASFTVPMKDYSVHVLSADPRQGQTLKEVENLLVEQIEKIKKGDFPDWLIPAIITNIRLEKTKGYESNRSRANDFVEAFIYGMEWEHYWTQPDRIARITKQDVMAFVKKNYHSNYVVVRKHTGEDKNTQKVEKPEITPVEVNREARSPFLEKVVNAKPAEIKPVFIDYANDVKHLSLKNKTSVLYNSNMENNLFNLYYVVDMGTNHNKKIGIAVEYLKYLGTSKQSASQVQEEFYKLGCSFDVFSSDDQIYVSLSGLTDNFEQAVILFENLMSDPKADAEALKNLSSDILKKRQDAKLSKDVILWSAMMNYAKYGAKSPFTNILSEKELNILAPAELISLIKNITSYDHRVLYYGPLSPELVVQILDRNHKMPATLVKIPEPVKFPELATDNMPVYVVHYDMTQAEIIMLSKGENYNKTLVPSLGMFNEYFGSGMSSIVFQDMRESKALAYSVFSRYQTPNRTDRAHYNVAYIGTQADKLKEAVSGMNALLSDMPKSEVAFASARDAIMKKIETERITKSDILFSYERARKLNLDYDIRKDVYERAQKFSLNEVSGFHRNYVSGKKHAMMVIGDKNKLDLKFLGTFGEVKFLTLEEIFGY